MIILHAVGLNISRDGMEVTSSAQGGGVSAPSVEVSSFFIFYFYFLFPHLFFRNGY